MKLPKTLEKIVVGASLIGCLSGCGGSDSSPTNPGNNNPPQEEILEESVTTSEGYVSFSDGKSAYIKDSSTNQPISNLEVSYLANSDYKIISIPSNENYLRSFNISDDSNLENITLKNKNEHTYDIQFLEGDDANLMKKFSANIMEDNNSRNVDCSSYLRTISGEEALGELNISEGILSIIGLDWTITLAGYIHELAGNTGSISYEEYLSSNNWDCYEMEDPTWQHEYPAAPYVHLRFPSNQPEIILEEVLVNENNVQIELNSSDELYYFELYNTQILDKTVTCRGPTEGVDNYFDWELYDLQNNLVSRGLNNSPDILNFNLSFGEYILKLNLFDDTSWKDEYYDSGLNRDYLEVPINISNNQYQNLEIIYSFGNPLGNGRLFEHNNQLWIHDSFNAYRVTHNYGIDSSSRKYIPGGTYDIVDIGNKCYGTLENSSNIIELDDYSLQQNGIVGNLDDKINIDFCWNGVSLVGSSKVYSETYNEWFYFTDKFDVNNFEILNQIGAIVGDSGQLSNFHNVSVDNIFLKTEWNNNFSYPYIEGWNYSSSNFENLINSFSSNVFNGESQDVTSLAHCGDYIYSTTNKNGIQKVNIHYLE